MFDSISLLEHLPSAANFRRQILEDLGHGRSVLCIINSSEFLQIFSEFCQVGVHRAEFHVENIDLSQVEQPAYPVFTIRDQFITRPPDSPAPPILQDLVLYEDLPEIIFFTGLDDLPAKTRQVWFHFFQEWNTAVHSASSTTYDTLPCLLGMSTLSAAEELPSDETRLRIYWWWSIPSSLEVSMFCRLREGNGDLSLTARASWREAILPAFAGNDLALVEHLWDAIFKDKNLLLEQLASFAQARDWTKEKLCALGLEAYLQQQPFDTRKLSQVPAAKDRTFWANGFLNQTAEQGVFISSAALAILGKEEEIWHRYWHGQISLIMPQLNSFRLSICKELTRKYGSAWAVEWSAPDSEEERDLLEKNPLAAEWGRLANALYKCPSGKDRRFLRPVEHARFVRNELAHYKPVSFADYQVLLNYIANL